MKKMKLRCMICGEIHTEDARLWVEKSPLCSFSVCAVCGAESYEVLVEKTKEAFDFLGELDKLRIKN